MKIKICGLKRDEDIAYVNLYQPDYIGFVFAGEKRRIDPATAVRLKRQLASSIQAVGVFVNAVPDSICRLVEDRAIDIVQLHGDEDEAYIEALRRMLPAAVPVMKAIRVQSTEQVLAADRLPVDSLLLDAFSSNAYGGEGKTFNHDLIPELTTPYMLAGGIDKENVIKILDDIKRKNVTLPYCVDVSSSVETDGYKDKSKIQEIVSVIRQY